jgi:hypothetical protein
VPFNSVKLGLEDLQQHFAAQGSALEAVGCMETVSLMDDAIKAMELVLVCSSMPFSSYQEANSF